MTAHRRALAAAATATALTLGLTACGGGSGFEDEGSGSEAQQTGPATLQVLIASSGDAETQAVQSAADAWAQETGNEVEVVVAQDLPQQLAQGFAGGNPPDVFYVDAGRFADLAEAGSLEPYVDQVEDADDFYPTLREAFTYEDEEYCLPKDFSTLALQIREDAWQRAGLTDADVPTTWDELRTVAQRLTTGGQTGLAIGDTRDRIGAFLVQNGGWVLGDDGQVTADSPENVEALGYVRELLDAGVAKYPSQLDAGWGGEAFGTGGAAMTIEGNWIRGAMANDYPDVEYRVVELPAGPAGKGTLQFTQCYGVAAASDAKEQAVSLVESLTSTEQQLANAEAYGVMPSRESARAEYVEQFPQDAPFLAGSEYGQGPVNAPGVESVLLDFDSALQQLPGAEPQQVLQQLQANLESVVGE
ncbi:sugar ABC transporter substrate-binding protein [Vallicoccus soli]|uniref:Extracellular solute-binding protein n=1 Tax=Vallicoccus soli TaxID=2339232 RepID=A0A3A3YYW0_9ACTN|nr:extracellular solute-binding protein [Vallicoccus soli]RJK95464.1 extracellular solute-binding protein [Vallicoccus soli]